MNDSFDRRLFLTGLVGSVLAGCATHPRESSISLRSFGRTALWIDAQGSVSDPDPNVADDGPPSPAMVEMLREAGLTAVSMTVGQPGVGEEGFPSTLASLASLTSWLTANAGCFVAVRSGRDMIDALDNRRLGVICNLQDSALLGQDIGRVDALQATGIRVMQLTYNLRNQCGSGCLEPDDQGVTPFGRDVIAKIEANRIVLDLSHSGPATTREAVELASRPPVISHTGCRDLVDFPRNVADVSLRALADRGGVVGIYMMPFLAERGMATREDFLRHLDHAVRVCGEDHVGIGTDGSLSPARSDEHAHQSHRRRYESRRSRKLAAPGEGPDRLNFVEGYNQTDRFLLVSHDLRRLGWRERRIEKVLGGNFARVFTEIWGS